MATHPDSSTTSGLFRRCRGHTFGLRFDLEYHNIQRELK